MEVADCHVTLVVLRTADWVPTESQWNELMTLLPVVERDRIARRRFPQAAGAPLVGRFNRQARDSAAGCVASILAAWSETLGLLFPSRTASPLAHTLQGYATRPPLPSLSARLLAGIVPLRLTSGAVLLRKALESLRWIRADEGKPLMAIASTPAESISYVGGIALGLRAVAHSVSHDGGTVVAAVARTDASAVVVGVDVVSLSLHTPITLRGVGELGCGEGGAELFAGVERTARAEVLAQLRALRARASVVGSVLHPRERESVEGLISCIENAVSGGGGGGGAGAECGAESDACSRGLGSGAVGGCGVGETAVRSQCTTGARWCGYYDPSVCVGVATLAALFALKEAVGKAVGVGLYGCETFAFDVGSIVGAVVAAAAAPGVASRVAFDVLPPATNAVEWGEGRAEGVDVSDGTCGSGGWGVGICILPPPPYEEWVPGNDAASSQAPGGGEGARPRRGCGLPWCERRAGGVCSGVNIVDGHTDAAGGGSIVAVATGPSGVATPSVQRILSEFSGAGGGDVEGGVEGVVEASGGCGRPRRSAVRSAQTSGTLSFGVIVGSAEGAVAALGGEG